MGEPAPIRAGRRCLQPAFGDASGAKWRRELGALHCRLCRECAGDLRIKERLLSGDMAGGLVLFAGAAGLAAGLGAVMAPCHRCHSGGCSVPQLSVPVPEQWRSTLEAVAVTGRDGTRENRQRAGIFFNLPHREPLRHISCRHVE